MALLVTGTSGIIAVTSIEIVSLRHGYANDRSNLWQTSLSAGVLRRDKATGDRSVCETTVRHVQIESG